MWGFADLHCHPMAHLGFGGHLFWGRPDGALDQALASCNGGDHGGARRWWWVFFSIAGEVTGQLTERPGEHRVDGWPTFGGWPAATTIVHQQMHIEWLRRAYEAGLRLMSALAVHNRLLAWLMEGGYETSLQSDAGAIRAQTAAMKDLARANSSWMEIAYSPAHARQIIEGSDKLAVVLGVEVDQLEYLYTSVDFQDLHNEAVNHFSQGLPTPRIAALARSLYDLGIRQVTPIHLSDNVFGGCALYSDKFATLNHWINRVFPRVEDGSRYGVDFKLGAWQRQITHNTAGDPRGPRDQVAAYADVSLSSHINRTGLAPAGKILLWELMGRSMLVDIDHMSAKATDEAFRIAQMYRYPLMSSHSSFRALARTRREVGIADDWSLQDYPESFEWPAIPHEGMRSEEDVRRIADLGGMVAPISVQSNVRFPSRLNGRGGDRTSSAWAVAYLHAVECMDGRGVAIGTDFNGLNRQPGRRDDSVPVWYEGQSPVPDSRAPLRPSRAGSRAFDLNADGLAHYGMLPDFLQDIKNLGLTPAELYPLFRSAQDYIEMWERCVDRSRDVRAQALSRTP